MHPKSYAKLYAAITAWTDAEASSDRWPDHWSAEQLVERMSAAAANVFDMSVESARNAVEREAEE